MGALNTNMKCEKEGCDMQSPACLGAGFYSLLIP